MDQPRNVTAHSPARPPHSPQLHTKLPSRTSQRSTPAADLFLPAQICDRHLQRVSVSPATRKKMRHPPDPHYSFTIPSVHDDITLNCRLYHPDILDKPQQNETAQSVTWEKRGIVMAHPYAPMGGSYDDRVVGIVVDEFLQAGWVVGTFNFRGAHSAKGRTSWTGRPELDDYTSFAAFFIHYMSYIRPLPTADTVFTIENPPHSPHVSGPSQQAAPLIVLGGYSYGSLILKHLAPIPLLLQPFTNPIPGSAYDEILLRAHKLSDQTNLSWINAARQHRQHHKHKHSKHHSPMQIGGSDTPQSHLRSSREIRRSMDATAAGSQRRSLDIKQRLRGLGHQHRKSDSDGDELRDQAVSIPPPPPLTQTQPDTATATISTQPLIPSLRISHLFISPLTPPVSTLLAPALETPRFWSHTSSTTTIPITTVDAPTPHTPTPTVLVIYGDEDAFASVKRTRAWIEGMKDIGSEDGDGDSGGVQGVEVKGAGHFWVERGTERVLRGAFRRVCGVGGLG